MDQSLRELVEETLRGKDERLLALCDVPGIVAALNCFGIFDLDMLAVNLETSLSALGPRSQTKSPWSRIPTESWTKPCDWSADRRQGSCGGHPCTGRREAVV